MATRAERRLRRRRTPAASLEGYRLGRRLMVAARENGAQDPQHFLEYLRRKRRGYDPRVDGPSALMRLVDDIQEFERREAEKLPRKAGT